MKDKLLELGYSEKQAETIINKKVYFQDDVDNITDKVKATLNKDFEKKINELTNETNKIKLETQFIENGGRKEAFDDFYASTKNYDFNDEKSFEKLKESKSYFFKHNTPYGSPNIDIDREREQIKLEDNSDLWEGTIYKKFK